MAAERFYLAEHPAADASGTLAFRMPGDRHNARAALDVGAYSKASFVAAGGDAELTIEACIAGVWGVLATLTVTADGAALTLADLAFAQLRVTWAGAVGAPDLSVAVALGC